MSLEVIDPSRLEQFSMGLTGEPTLVAQAPLRYSMVRDLLD